MKVFVNQEGELAIGSFDMHRFYQWLVYDGHENIWSSKHPTEWGWTFLGDL
jgi:hypothetical protein